MSSSGVRVAVGEGLAVGLGLGVGVGVLMFAFTFVFEFVLVLKFELTLKLKLLSIPRLVLRFVFASAKFALLLTFVLSARSFCKNQKPAAPMARTAIVPSIVSTTTLNVFAFGGA